MPEALQAAFAALIVCAFGAVSSRRLFASANDGRPEILARLHPHGDDPRAQNAHPVLAHDVRRRAVIVVIDGLGEDLLDSLARRGALGPIAWRAHTDVGSPSFSRPVYHLLLTGVPQEVSGIRLNAHRGPARADGLATRVRRAGGRVGWLLQSVPWFHELFGAPGDDYVRGAEALRPEAFAEMYRQGADLIVWHLVDTDTAGHRHGAASAQYHAAAADAVRRVRAARELVAHDPDASRTVWFVGADHGHLRQGGHGGPEMAVRRVVWLGLGGEAQAATLTVPDRHAATSLARTFAGVLGVEPPVDAFEDALPFPGVDPAAPGPSVAHDLRGLFTSVRHRARVLALLRLGAFGTPLLLFAVWLARRGHAVRVVGTLLPIVAAFALYAAVGPGWSLSTIRTLGYFIQRSLIAMTVGALFAWPLARRLGARAFDTIAAAGLLPLAAQIATWGSLGRSLQGDVGLVVWPATGLVPMGVALAVLTGESVRLALTRARAERVPTSRATPLA